MVRTSNLSKVFEFVDIYNKFSYYKRAVSKISLDFNLGMRFNRNLQVVEEVLDALRYRQQDWCSATKEIMSPMIEDSGDIGADQLGRIQQLTNICPYSAGLYLRNTFMRLTKDFISKGKSLATSNEPVDLVSAYRYLILGGSAHGLSITRNLSSNRERLPAGAFRESRGASREETELFEHISLVFFKTRAARRSTGRFLSSLTLGPQCILRWTPISTAPISTE
jgi:hypothetical protein